MEAGAIYPEKRVMKALWLLGAFLFLDTSQASAASFCLAGPGLSPQCIYDDVGTCKRAARPPSTDCFANEEVKLMQHGNAEYCLVTSQRVAECIYSDRGQCNAQALKQNAVCKSNTDNDIKENPYRYDTRVQY